MEDSEKNRYIEFLLQQKEERDRTIAEKDAAEGGTRPDNS